jgi:hypothetical protein
LKAKRTSGSQLNSMETSIIGRNAGWTISVGSRRLSAWAGDFGVAGDRVSFELQRVVSTIWLRRLAISASTRSVAS